MRRTLQTILGLAGALLLSVPATAGVYTDDFGKCLVKSATNEDHIAFVRWMFGALSVHPALRSMTTITQQQRDEFSQQMASISERLIYTDCRKEAIDGLKYEGPTIFAAGFKVFGEVAARDLFRDPQVQVSLADLQKHFDKTKNAALFKDAGVPLPEGQ